MLNVERVKAITQAWAKENKVAKSSPTAEAKLVNGLIDGMGICNDGKVGARKLVEHLYSKFGDKIDLTSVDSLPNWTPPPKGTLIVYDKDEKSLVLDSKDMSNVVYVDSDQDHGSWTLKANDRGDFRAGTAKEITAFVKAYNKHDYDLSDL